MSETKFTYIYGGSTSSPEINADFAAADKCDTVKVGRSGVFFKEGFKTRYIPFSFPERAFIRIQEVNVRTCCCKNSMFYYKLMFVKDGKEYGNIMSENEAEMDRALALIRERAPEMAIGFVGK